MKIFHCGHCNQLVFFENTTCVNCGHTLADLPDRQDMGMFQPDGGDRWRAISPGGGRAGVPAVRITASRTFATGPSPPPTRSRIACRAGCPRSFPT